MTDSISIAQALPAVKRQVYPSIYDRHPQFYCKSNAFKLNSSCQQGNHQPSIDPKHTFFNAPEEEADETHWSALSAFVSMYV